MSRVVIDASAMGPLIFNDEADDAIDALPDLLARGHCIAPLHWRLEVANMVLMGGRRGRATRDASFILTTLAMLPVALDTRTADMAWTATSDLAMTHKLTIYDAAYLELALRMRLPLMTLDTDLAAAAQSVGVEVPRAGA